MTEAVAGPFSALLGFLWPFGCSESPRFCHRCERRLRGEPLETTGYMMRLRYIHKEKTGRSWCPTCYSIEEAKGEEAKWARWTAMSRARVPQIHRTEAERGIESIPL